jgi:hypothetical protein
MADPEKGDAGMREEIEKMNAATFRSVMKMRRRYGSYINNAWFLEPAFKHLTGRRPRWGWKGDIPEADKDPAEKSREIMREICSMPDRDLEVMLVSKSTLEAANYSIKVKGERLCPEAERLLLERCKGKKSRFAALLSYCGRWDIMPENMTEVTMVAGFEGGRRGRIGVDFIKKLTENKRKCKELLAQIMKLEGIGEDEPIKRIMERLG